MSTKDAYEIKAGDVFTYDGKEYTAVKDARGEFRPYVEVANTGSGQPGEIVLHHGATVTLK